MEDTKKNVTAPVPAPIKEPAKPKAKPKTTKKVAKKKRKSVIIQTNIARGFFITGLLGAVFFGLMAFDQLGWLTTDIEIVFANDNELFQISLGLLSIGLFSFTKK